MTTEAAKKRDMFLLIFVTATILFYKLYKRYILSIGYDLECDDYCAYLFDQKMFTVYRAILGLSGLFLAYKCKLLVTKINNLSFTLVSYFLLLPYLFFSTLYFSSVSFMPNEFFNDLFFNLFTGIYEEVFFRILLFGILRRHLSVLKSAIISSLVFSFWHLDVSSGPMFLFFVFSFGMYAALAMTKKVSGIELIMFHFVWDQVMFGLTWSGLTTEVSEMFHLVLSVVVWVAAAILFKLNRPDGNKRAAVTV